MARMQLNCVWTDSILRCLHTASLLNSICDVKAQLIMEKQIKFSKLNFLLPLPVRVSRHGLCSKSGLAYLLGCAHF